MLRKLVIAFTIIMTFVGCGTLPDSGVVSSVVEANISISSLKSLASPARAILIDEDYVVVGRVVSSDEEGNHYRTLFVDDGTAAIAVRVDAYDLHTLYPEGLRLSLHLKGCAMAYVRGVLTIGMPAEGYDYDAVEAIASPQCLARVLRRSDDIALVEPVELSLSELRGEHCGRRVRLHDLVLGAATSIETLESATLEDAVWRGSVLYYDAEGDSVAVYTSDYARFAEECVPHAVARISGILEWGSYGRKECYQIVMSHVEDCVARK